jgi:hypothetical protein
MADCATWAFSGHTRKGVPAPAPRPLVPTGLLNTRQSGGTEALCIAARVYRRSGPRRGGCLINRQARGIPNALLSIASAPRTTPRARSAKPRGGPARNARQVPTPRSYIGSSRAAAKIAGLLAITEAHVQAPPSKLDSRCSAVAPLSSRRCCCRRY